MDDQSELNLVLRRNYLAGIRLLMRGPWAERAFERLVVSYSPSRPTGRRARVKDRAWTSMLGAGAQMNRALEQVASHPTHARPKARLEIARLRLLQASKGWRFFPLSKELWAVAGHTPLDAPKLKMLLEELEAMNRERQAIRVHAKSRPYSADEMRSLLSRCRWLLRTLEKEREAPQLAELVHAIKTQRPARKGHAQEWGRLTRELNELEEQADRWSPWGQLLQLAFESNDQDLMEEFGIHPSHSSVASPGHKKPEKEVRIACAS